MNLEEARAEGKWMTKLHQEGSGKWVLLVNDPHWKTILEDNAHARR